MFELVDNVPSNAIIKVIGVGGGGGNAVKHMIDNNVEGVDFICANTDAQALSDIESKTVLQLGGDITKGSFRLHARAKRSLALADLRWLHTDCWWLAGGKSHY